MRTSTARACASRPDVAAVLPEQRGRSAAFVRNLRQAFAENRMTLVAVVILAVLLVCAVFGNWLTPHDPLASDAAAMDPEEGAD